jgi:cell wall-associated NlpC family hydrolase
VAGLSLCLWVAACSNGPSAEQQIPPTTAIRHAVAMAAIRQLGAPYQARGNGPKAFAAAGLVHYAYHQAGADLPRGLQAQLDTGKPITLTHARPADLAFFQVDGAGGRPRKTVGLLISKHRMVIAIPNKGDQDDGVQLADIDADYWRARLVGVLRVLPRKNKTAASESA